LTDDGVTAGVTVGAGSGKSGVIDIVMDAPVGMWMDSTDGPSTVNFLVSIEIGHEVERVATLRPVAKNSLKIAIFFPSV
jgi:hypothetical protein